MEIIQIILFGLAIFFFSEILLPLKSVTILPANLEELLFKLFIKLSGRNMLSRTDIFLSAGKPRTRSIPNFVHSLQLSDQAEISLLTCSPGTEL
ncbi:unnamed protein product, partial [marine sediment metagenome]